MNCDHTESETRVHVRLWVGPQVSHREVSPTKPKNLRVGEDNFFFFLVNRETSFGPYHETVSPDLVLLLIIEEHLD